MEALPQLHHAEGHDQLIAKNREKYLGYALTIIRAYLKSGERAKVAAFGSFEAWSRMVREPLVWLGMVDPVDSIEAVRADDPEIAAMSALFAAWPSGGNWWAAADLIKASSDSNSFSDTPLRRALLEVAGDRDMVNRKSLGRYLSRIKRRPVNGLYIDASVDKNKKTNIYQLATVRPKLELVAA